MKTSISNAARKAFSNLIAPQICACCGSFSAIALPLCASCLDRRYYEEAKNPRQQRCVTCGRPLISARVRCVRCREGKDAPLYLDGIHALYPYDSANQTLLTSWKIEGLRSFSEPFTDCLAMALRRIAPASCAIVPVPPRPGKIRDRGWDQVEDLARLLCARYGFSVIRPLVRRAGIQQKKLGHEGRLSNLKGAIDCTANESLPPEVYLIDDLTATGSTLESCAHALKIAGVGKVYGLALFYD